MEKINRVFGPIPSRRLGSSLGISPIPERTCNHTCVYCQLGRTRHLIRDRRMFFQPADILAEFDLFQERQLDYDVISVVGEGEPTLYLGLGELLCGLKQRTTKPLAVITNGALLADPQVRAELQHADLTLPSLDAYDQASYKAINRPHGRMDYEESFNGLVEFSHAYAGQVWLEVMLLDGVNDDPESLDKLAARIAQVKHDRVYINTPVRPPAESNVRPASHERIAQAVERLNGISIESLVAGRFHSNEPDEVEAVIGIIRRHPMNQFELKGFLASRQVPEQETFYQRLAADPRVSVVEYKGILSYRAK